MQVRGDTLTNNHGITSATAMIYKLGEKFAIKISDFITVSKDEFQL